VLGLLFITVFLYGCTQTNPREYVCPSGQVVLDPSLCATSTATPLLTATPTPSLISTPTPLDSGRDIRNARVATIIKDAIAKQTQIGVYRADYSINLSANLDWFGGPDGDRGVVNEYKRSSEFLTGCYGWGESATSYSLMFLKDESREIFNVSGVNYLSDTPLAYARMSSVSTNAANTNVVPSFGADLKYYLATLLQNGIYSDTKGGWEGQTANGSEIFLFNQTEIRIIARNSMMNWDACEQIHFIVSNKYYHSWCLDNATGLPTYINISYKGENQDDVHIEYKMATLVTVANFEYLLVNGSFERPALNTSYVIPTPTPRPTPTPIMIYTPNPVITPSPTPGANTGGLTVRAETVARCSQMSTQDGQDECYRRASVPVTGECNLDYCLLIGSPTTKEQCLTIAASNAYIYNCGTAAWRRDYCQYLSTLTTREACYSYTARWLGASWCSSITTTNTKDDCLMHAGKGLF